MFTPVRKENVTDLIYNQMLDMIFSGEWMDGYHIPSEAALAKQFGVSRAPIREAIQRLNAMGVLVSQQGKGSFVSGSPSNDVFSIFLSILGSRDEKLRDLLEYRMLVEPYCAKVMAKNPSPAFLEELLTYAPDPDSEAFRIDQVFEKDILFHNAIIMNGSNSIFKFMQQYSRETMSKHVAFFSDLHKDPLRIGREHFRIYQAIAERDGEKAYDRMYKHLVYVLKIMLKEEERRRYARADGQAAGEEGGH